MFVTEGGNNDTGWSNARYDELIGLAARTEDQRQRMEYFQEAEAILLDEAPVAPIYFYQYNHLVSPSVRGWHSNVMKHVNYKGVYLERSEEHTSELQSRGHLVCRLLLEEKKQES